MEFSCPKQVRIRKFSSFQLEKVLFIPLLSPPL
jgi:hypothetical protein